MQCVFNVFKLNKGPYLPDARLPKHSNSASTNSFCMLIDLVATGQMKGSVQMAYTCHDEVHIYMNDSGKRKAINHEEQLKLKI